MWKSLSPTHITEPAAICLSLGRAQGDPETTGKRKGADASAHSPPRKSQDSITTFLNVKSFQEKRKSEYIERCCGKPVLINAHVLKSSSQVETYIQQVNAYFVLDTNYILFDCHSSSTYHFAMEDIACILEFS